MTQLFLAHIGPVQSFIASGRRPRDLWYGSQLLSDLSKQAAEVVRERCGSQSLIFPVLAASSSQGTDQKFDDQQNIANKILAHINCDPQQLGHDIKEELDTRLNKLWKVAVAQIEKSGEADGIDLPRIDKEIAQAQINELLEFYWVAVPYDETRSYKEARCLAEALMDARKNTRAYGAITWGSEAPKSSIDGQLECVIPKDRFPQIKRGRTGGEPDNERKKRLNFLAYYHATPAERLSAIDLLKRRGGFTQEDSGDRIASTSHIAALPYLHYLDPLRDNQKVKDCFLAYIHTIIGTQSSILSRKELDYLPRNSPKPAILEQYDAAILFPERLMEKVVNPPRGWFQKIEGALEAFFQTVDEELKVRDEKHRSIRPSPYYAILCADGDRMGETIDHLAGQANGLARHQELSRALGDFSKGVRKIVEKYGGVPIYSGGDDIVALLPVHTALACARDLAQAFREQLGSFKFQQEESPTLSVGLAIVHHLSLLQDCLDIARKAEKKAKDVDGKNALAIIIQKRGGEEYALAGSWGSPKRDTLGQAGYLEELIGYSQRDELPRGAAYELREVAQRLTIIAKSSEENRDGLTQQQHELPPILWLEAKRILRRKLKLPQSRLARQNQQGEDWLKRGEEILDRLLARIEAPAEPVKNEGDAANQKKQPERVSLQKFIDELIIAQELAKLMQLSPREAQ